MVKLKLSNVHLVDTFGAVSTVEARSVKDEDSLVTILEVESRLVDGDCSGRFPAYEAPSEEDEDNLVTVLEVESRLVDVCSSEFVCGFALYL